MSNATTTTPTTKAKGTRPGPAWFSREELAAILDVTTTQIDRRFRKLVGPDDLKTIDRRLWFRARGVIDAMIAEAQRQAGTPEADDPMLLAAAGGSPALEAYRSLRVDLLGLELAERRGQLVRADLLREAMQAGITAMRQTGDKLIRQHGNAAGELFNEGVDDFEASALRVIATFDTKGPQTTTTKGTP